MKFMEYIKNKIVMKKVNEQIVPEKPEKEVKKFEVGDVLVLIDTKKSNKLPQDAYEFLTTYKKFTVKKVTEKGNLDLGCIISKNTEGGKEVTYIFKPNRFELESKVKSGNIKPIEHPEED